MREQNFLYLEIFPHHVCWHILARVLLAGFKYKELIYTSFKVLSWWLRWQRICLQCRRQIKCRFDPWVGKISWRRKWQPTLVFLPGQSHGQRSLVNYRPWNRKELNTTEQLILLTFPCFKGLNITWLLSYFLVAARTKRYYNTLSASRMGSKKEVK